MKKPNWTILYDMESLDGYFSVVREFFDSREIAEKCAKQHALPGEQTCTIRPYHSSDEPFLRPYRIEDIKP